MSDELLVGKYKTTEELENGYKNLKTSYDSLASNKNKFEVPGEYSVKGDLLMMDNTYIKEAKESAIKYGYTQDQFEKKLKDIAHSEEKKSKERQESLKGIEDLDLIKDYVNNEMGFSDKTFHGMSREELLKIKEMKENSFNTGNTNVNSSYAAELKKPTKEDAQAAYKRMEANKHGTQKDREYYKREYLEIVARL